MIVCVGQAALKLRVVLAGALRPGHDHAAAGVRHEPSGEALLSACAVARLGFPVVLLAAVGLDDRSVRLKRFLQHHGPDPKHLISRSDCPTSLEVAIESPLEPHDALTRVVAPGAALLLDRQALKDRRPLLGAATVLVADGGLPLDTLAYLATTRHLKQARRLLHLGAIREVWREAGAREVIRGFDELIVTPGALEDWLGRPLPQPNHLYEAAHTLRRDLGVEVVVDLMGLGAMGFVGGELKHLPGYTLEVAEPGHLRPGLLAGLAVASWNGVSGLERLALALRLSALCAHNHGGPENFPTLEELSQFQTFVG